MHPDPTFPTVRYPNPEEGKGALSLAFAAADKVRKCAAHKLHTHARTYLIVHMSLLRRHSIGMGRPLDHMTL